MAAVLALSAFGPAMIRRMEEATLSVLSWVSSPDVVVRKGVIELFMTVGMHVAMAAVPVDRDLHARRRRRQRRPGRLQAVAEGARARLQEAQPAHRLQEHLRHEHGRRVDQERAQDRRRRRHRRHRRLPQARRDGRAGGHARRGAAPAPLHADPARRPVGRARLPGDRRRRLPLPEAPLREEPQDGQGGGQAGAQAAGAAVGDQGRPAPPRDGARPRPHDGRGPDRRRRRHQPDALLGRAQVRRRQARPRSSSPRAPTTSPCASAARRPPTASP